MKKLKKYRIEVQAVVTGYIHVRAESKEKAVEISEDQINEQSFDDIFGEDYSNWELTGEPEEVK